MGWWFNHQLVTWNWCFGWGILGSLKTKRIGVYYSYSSYQPLKVPRRSPSILIPNPKRPNSKIFQKKSKKDSNSFRFFQLAIFFLLRKNSDLKPPGIRQGRNESSEIWTKPLHAKSWSRGAEGFFLDKVCYVENKRCMDAWRFFSWFFWYFVGCICWVGVNFWFCFIFLFVDCCW